MFGRNKQDQIKDSNALALRPAESNKAAPIARSNTQPTVNQPVKEFTQLQGQNCDGVVFVGKGTQVSGDFKNCTVVEIQGKLEGTVSSNAVVIREGGAYRGDIRTDHAEIQGEFDGRLTVHGLLDVRGTGRISGEVSYERLVVAEGALIGGQIKSTETIDGASQTAATVPTPSSEETHTPATNGHMNGWPGNITAHGA